jgi:hypothetical protein
VSSARLLLLLVAVTPGHLFAEKVCDAPVAVRLADDAETHLASRADAVAPAPAVAPVRTPRPARVDALVRVVRAPASVFRAPLAPTEPGAARGPPARAFA